MRKNLLVTARMVRLIFAVVTFLIFVCKPCAALTLTTEEYPPFKLLDEHTKEPIGITVDKVVELMHRAHEPLTIASYPWALAYQLALQSEDTCVFSTSRTPEREALFTWIGSLAKRDWAKIAGILEGKKKQRCGNAHVTQELNQAHHTFDVSARSSPVYWDPGGLIDGTTGSNIRSMAFARRSLSSRTGSSR